MMAILKNSSDCLAEIKKTKSAVRQQQKEVVDKCECAKKWKSAGEQLNFIKNNQSKIESNLKGARDICPPDLGKSKS